MADSIVKNTPKCKMKLIRKVRGTLEHRAEWLYLLLKEAEAKGLAPEEYAAEAVRKCGVIQGTRLAAGDDKKSFKTLKKRLFGYGARKVFEMKIVECTDDKLSIDFHYCPLVAAWQNLGATDEEIAKLCDIAMSGDAGIASCFGGKLTLGKVIAKGADICEIRFSK